jgi:ribosomal protein L37AE/L43A
MTIKIRKLIRKLFYKYIPVTKCEQCKKRIIDSEYAKNWGICDSCWDELYEQ